MSLPAIWSCVPGRLSARCGSTTAPTIGDAPPVPAPTPSPNAGPCNGGQAPADAARDLSAALAARRHAVGFTQKELADLIGCSVTTVGHAETGRTWQSRRFWEHAEKTLNANGELLDLHDRYRAAAVPPDLDAKPVADPAPGPPTLVRIVLVWSDGSTAFALPDRAAEA
jgi:hypothetical protein